MEPSPDGDHAPMADHSPHCGGSPAFPADASALLRATWASAAPLVRLCLDPSPLAAAAVSRAPMGTLHAAVHRVCDAPRCATPESQPRLVYALLRAQLVVHARAVARVLGDVAGGEARDAAMRAEDAFADLVEEEAVLKSVWALQRSLIECDEEGGDTHLLFVVEEVFAERDDREDANSRQSSFEKESETSIVMHSPVEEENDDSLEHADEAHLQNLRILRTYALLWAAFARGLQDVSALFSFIDQRWVRYDEKAVAGLYHDEEIRVLGTDLTLHHVHTTALVAWLREVVNPYGARVARAALEVISRDRARRSFEVALCGAAQAAEYGPYHVPRSLPVHLLKPVAESFCVIGRMQAEAEKRKAELAYYSDGLPSTVASGLSQAAMYPNPLRVPSPDLEATMYGLYRSLFETDFVNNASSFFVDESAALFEKKTLSVREYVRCAEALLNRELALVKSYADKSTVSAFCAVLERALVGGHSAVLQAEADEILKDRSVGDLSKLYGLLRRIPGSLQGVHVRLRSHVEAEGLAALRPWSRYDSSQHGETKEEWLPPRLGTTESTCPAQVGFSTDAVLLAIVPRTPGGGFVQAAWTVYAQFEELSSRVFFPTDRDVSNALERGCERFLNSVRAAPELLAEFCHDLLEEAVTELGEGDPGRPGENGERLSAQELAYTSFDGQRISSQHEKVIDATEHIRLTILWIERVTRLFRFLTEKDVFQRSYSMKLSRRLVFRTSFSAVGELRMLDALRDTCGRDYTSRLQRMFADIVSSRKVSDGFARYLSVSGEDVGSRVTLNTCVLSSGAWSMFHGFIGAPPPSPASPNQSESVPPMSGTISPLPVGSPSTAAAAGLGLLRREQELAPGFGGGITLRGGGDSPIASPSASADAASASDAKSGEAKRDADSPSTLACTALASLPARLSWLWASFVDYYGSAQPRHERRVLKPIYNLCRVEIAGRIHVGSDEMVTIEASLPQAAILLKFNDENRFSVSHLASSLDFSVNDTIRVAQVLLNAKLLHVESENDFNSPSRLDASSVLHVSNNLGSCRRNRRSRCPLALVAFDGEESARVRRSQVGIISDRRQQVKASIVRIMKKERTVKEEDLVRLVQEQLSRWFSPRESDIISGIAALVENEYIEPVEGGSYEYVP